MKSTHGTKNVKNWKMVTKTIQCPRVLKNYSTNRGEWIVEWAQYWAVSVVIAIAIWAHIWRQREKIRNVSCFTFSVPKHKEQVLQELLYSPCFNLSLYLFWISPLPQASTEYAVTVYLACVAGARWGLIRIRRGRGMPRCWLNVQKWTRRKIR